MLKSLVIIVLKILPTKVNVFGGRYISLLVFLGSIHLCYMLYANTKNYTNLKQELIAL